MTNNLGPIIIVCTFIGGLSGLFLGLLKIRLDGMRKERDQAVRAHDNHKVHVRILALSLEANRKGNRDLAEERDRTMGERDVARAELAKLVAGREKTRHVGERLCIYPLGHLGRHTDGTFYW